MIDRVFVDHEPSGDDKTPTASLLLPPTNPFGNRQQHSSWTTSQIMATTPCPFLDRLPTELRLHIYSFALHHSQTITISTTELVGKLPDVVHRLYGGGRKPYPCIPLRHEPVVESQYNGALLSSTTPAVTHIGSSTTSSSAAEVPQESHEHLHTAHVALLLVNKQINDELTSHFNIPQNRNTSLFIQYPHGLHVCRTLTPHLLRQARSIHLAGTYLPTDFSPARAACLHQSFGKLAPTEIKYNGDRRPDSMSQLSELIRTLFGPTPTHDVAKFEMRIYYPGDDSYSTVWGDDSSPTVVALRNICCGEIAIEVWRGRYGTGVYLSAKRCVERKRVVSTVWRRLEEGMSGEPGCGSWVVDPKWPSWED